MTNSSGFKYNFRFLFFGGHNTFYCLFNKISLLFYVLIWQWALQHEMNQSSSLKIEHLLLSITKPILEKDFKGILPRKTWKSKSTNFIIKRLLRLKYVAEIHQTFNVLSRLPTLFVKFDWQQWREIGNTAF